MANAVLIEDQIQVPLHLRTLDDFRQWALSDSFPQRGRIDFIAGMIEVEMAPEDLFCHGTLKTEIITVLGERVKPIVDYYKRRRALLTGTDCSFRRP